MSIIIVVVVVIVVIVIIIVVVVIIRRINTIEIDFDIKNGLLMCVWKPSATVTGRR